MSSSLKFFVLATSIGYFAFQSSKKRFFGTEEEIGIDSRSESGWGNYRKFAGRYARKRGERRGKTSREQLFLRMEKEYMDLLGIDQNSPFEVIKSQYRLKISLHHPDRVYHQGEEARVQAEKETKAINQAFAFFKKAGRV